MSLLQCMEISVNGKREKFRLTDRIEAYWKQVAIALNFPEYRIRVFATETSPVYCMLNEWLRGANMEEDRRPLTWKTLITTLQDAKMHEEAKLLETHLAMQFSGELSLKFMHACRFIAEIYYSYCVLDCSPCFVTLFAYTQQGYAFGRVGCVCLCMFLLCFVVVIGFRLRLYDVFMQKWRDL